MRLKSILTMSLFCACALGFSTWGRSGEPPDVRVKNYQGIPYWSGGVGEDDRDALQQVQEDYDLKLVFADRSGDYLADVNVLILDAAGKTVLEAVSEGPWFFARLPAGSYTVSAGVPGSQSRRKVRIGPRGRTTLQFHLQD
jgi:hypothetical protein